MTYNAPDIAEIATLSAWHVARTMVASSAAETRRSGQRARGSHDCASMPNPLLVRRVEILEEKVDALSQLPERVSAIERQLVALRDDFTSFRTEVRAEFVAVRAEVRAGDEETRREMRVLHEDVISRIALLQEGIDRRNGLSGPSAGTRTPPKRRR